MIRSFFITAWAGTQGFDAKLVHHILVVLIGSEGYWRWRNLFGRGTLSVSDSFTNERANKK
jgi:hypothetical protein